MAKKKKFYSVAVGRETGVFESWSEAEALVKGFPGAMFKGFPTREEAKVWLAHPVYGSGAGSGKKKKKVEHHKVDHPADEIAIYTDGGAINNPGPGGYGIVILDGDLQQELSGGFRFTTNNRMELTACIIALTQLEQKDKAITLYSDSRYVVNGINKGWAAKWRRNGWRKADGKEAVNQDLWARLLECIAGLKITFKWVRGHSGHPLNERCDRLAVAAARGEDLPVDDGYTIDQS